MNAKKTTRQTQVKANKRDHVGARKCERSLVLIKPDGVQRMLIGEVISRFERAGLKLVGMKMVWPASNVVERHYPKHRQWLEEVGEKAKAGLAQLGMEDKRTPFEIGKWVRGQLGRYLAIGPVVAMVWQGTDAVGNIRQLVGSTNPILADVGTIRGDLTIDTIAMANAEGRSVRNLIHASSDVKEAAREIALWFRDAELHEYKNVMDKVLHDGAWDR